MAEIEPKYIKKMNDLGKFINEFFNPDKPNKTGFILLTFDYEEGGRMNYISNSNKEDCIKAMEEFLLRAKGIVGEEEEMQ